MLLSAIFTGQGIHVLVVPVRFLRGDLSPSAHFRGVFLRKEVRRALF